MERSGITEEGNEGSGKRRKTEGRENDRRREMSERDNGQTERKERRKRGKDRDRGRWKNSKKEVREKRKQKSRYKARKKNAILPKTRRKKSQFSSERKERKKGKTIRQTQTNENKMESVTPTTQITNPRQSFYRLRNDRLWPAAHPFLFRYRPDYQLRHISRCHKPVSNTANIFPRFYEILPPPPPSPSSPFHLPLTLLSRAPRADKFPNRVSISLMFSSSRTGR